MAAVSGDGRVAVGDAVEAGDRLPGLCQGDPLMRTACIRLPFCA